MKLTELNQGIKINILGEINKLPLNIKSSLKRPQI